MSVQCRHVTVEVTVSDSVLFCAMTDYSRVKQVMLSGSGVAVAGIVSAPCSSHQQASAILL